MNAGPAPRDAVAKLLLLALVTAVAACLPLSREGVREVFANLAVIDITQSMNVEDYRIDGRPVSRLAFSVAALRGAVAELPCGSKLGLAVFTERRPLLLFEPIETCDGYAAISTTLANLDWRMAWAADSRIADGLYNTMESFRGYQATLLFLTDGHEAPPVNPRYRRSFDDLRGAMRGALIGVGAGEPSPIPRYDESGRRAGFVRAEDVPHRSTFGLSELAPDQIEGYHARNAPFGSEATIGSEHLSAMREDYLRQLAGDSGLGFARLSRAGDLLAAMTDPRDAVPVTVRIDLRWIPASLALALLTLAYLRTAAGRVGLAGRWLARMRVVSGRASLPSGRVDRARDETS